MVLYGGNMKKNSKLKPRKEKEIEVKVKNFTSERGNSIANQFIIHVGDSTYFQSYETVIVEITDSQVYLDEKWWDFSQTTGKYRNIFLDEKKSETKKKIESGKYILKDLNK